MDTFLTNAWVYTPDRVFRRGSVFIRRERIASVLYDDDDPTSPGANRLETIDLDEAYILPGFVDTHIHLTSIALKSARCDLSGARSAKAVAELLAEWANEHREAPHVMGVEWDENLWEDPSYPTRKMLDAIDDTRCVLARRICGHVGVANTPLLARISEHPGLIEEDTGVVREHALWEAGRMCEPELTTLHEGIETAIRSLHRLGITAIHDIVEPAKFDYYLEGIKRSSVPLGIDVLLHTHPNELAGFIEKVREANTPYVRLAGVKCFLDGSLGGHTAALNEPYVGTDNERGTLFLSDEELRSIVQGCHAAGCACAMHAIGDRAIDQALGALTTVPADAENFRIEHCEIVGENQLSRLKDSPVFLAMQPNFMRRWGESKGAYARRLGEERTRHCNPWRTLKDADIPFVFGSDGMPPGPLYGLSGATEHPISTESLTPAEAIHRYTTLPSMIGAHKRDAGTIEKGKLADLVILDGNPLDGDFDRLTILKTIVAGATVYDGDDA